MSFMNEDEALMFRTLVYSPLGEHAKENVDPDAPADHYYGIVFGVLETVCNCELSVLDRNRLLALGLRSVYLGRRPGTITLGGVRHTVQWRGGGASVTLSEAMYRSMLEGDELTCDPDNTFVQATRRATINDELTIISQEPDGKNYTVGFLDLASGGYSEGSRTLLAVHGARGDAVPDLQAQAAQSSG